MKLQAGIPTFEAYQALLTSDQFKELERFSNRFLSENRAHLVPYARKWVSDPLHNWSRQWEYPFVFNCIRSTTGDKNNPLAILDAGSGVTFFPYFIQHAYNATHVHTCDRDASYTEVFDRIYAGVDKKVTFSCTEIQRTGYEDNFFDLVYCISVLEHTADYAATIAEFLRITKPHGKLIVTFDISLDGTREISPERADHLRSELLRSYCSEDDASAPEIFSAIDRPNILTTDLIKDFDMELLPWKPLSLMDRIKSLLRGKNPAAWLPCVTIYCLSLTKPEL